MGFLNRRKRRRGDGTTYQENIYTMIYYDPVKGYTRKESTGTADYKKAELELAKRLTAIDKNEHIITGVAKVRVAELLEQMIATKKNENQSSANIEEQRMNKHLMPFFGKFKAVHVTPVVVEKYKSERRLQGAKNSTVNRELALLRRAFTIGVEMQQLTMIPYIKKYAEDNARKGFFEQEHFDLLEGELPDELKGLCTFDFFTGVRRAEIISILWAQVDRERCVIRLECTKNGEPRDVYYRKNKTIKDIVEHQWGKKVQIEAKIKKEIDHLFFRFGTGHGTKPGAPIRSFTEAFKSAMKRAGIKDYEYMKHNQKVSQRRIFHDFRRTAVRNLINEGASESLTMKISGHRTNAILKRYNIVDSRDTEEALGKVDFKKRKKRKKETS